MQPEELEDYIKQWSSLYKTQEEDSLGLVRDVWESGGNDHYAFATVYFRLALDRTGEAYVKDWESKQEILNNNMSPDVLEEARKTEPGYYE